MVVEVQAELSLARVLVVHLELISIVVADNMRIQTHVDRLTILVSLNELVLELIATRSMMALAHLLVMRMNTSLSFAPITIITTTGNFKSSIYHI